MVSRPDGAPFSAAPAAGVPVPTVLDAGPLVVGPDHHMRLMGGDPFVAERADIPLRGGLARNHPHPVPAPVPLHDLLGPGHAGERSRLPGPGATAGHGSILALERPSGVLSTLRIVSASADLQALIASRHPVLTVTTRDEDGLRTAVQQCAAALHLPVWLWTTADGLAVAGGPGQTGTREAAGALSFLRDLDRPFVALFLDGQPVLDDPVALRQLKHIAAAPSRTVLLAGLSAGIPDSLAGLAVPWTPPAPDRRQLRALLDRLLPTLPRLGLTVDVKDADGLVDAILGLTPQEAERVILQQAVVDRRLDDSDAAAAQQARAQLLSAGPLQLVDPDVTFADVGGLAALKQWLEKRSKGFQPQARTFGLEPPRGVLLAGVPGCGKSLVARAIAGSWRMPLASLDVGRLHGSLVGESEGRMREALAAATAMAPVVLWIDEIEKVFGEGEERDGGVAQRVLGVLLSWLQDRPDGVFVAATCNDVTALPPEVTRRGRFDELFFVDLPDPLERGSILAHHLRQRKRDPARFDLNALAAASEGFSGAELESAVTAALYTAFDAGRDLDTAVLLAELRQTVPLSVTRAEDVTALRRWASGRARPAGGWPPPRAQGTSVPG